MSLLSGLFTEIKKGGAPRFVVAENVTRTATAAVHPDQQHSVLKPTHAQLPPSRELLASPEGDSPPYYIHTAATASPEWVAARDQHINHLMTCRDCHAPIGRYCATGAELRQRYNALTEEQAP